MPTDEDLAKLLYETGGEAVLWTEYGDDQPATWDDLPEYDALDQGENFWLPPKQQFRDMARAIRAALTPAVAPLRPDEIVEIPDSGHANTTIDVGLWDDGDMFIAVGDEAWVNMGTGYLDAAGVATLRETLDRWAMAQGEGR